MEQNTIQFEKQIYSYMENTILGYDIIHTETFPESMFVAVSFFAKYEYSDMIREITQHSFRLTISDGFFIFLSEDEVIPLTELSFWKSLFFGRVLDVLETAESNKQFIHGEKNG